MRRMTAAAAGVLWVLATAASANGIAIAPQRLTIPADSRAAAINIRNDDAAAHVLQADLRTWTQQDGRDHYAPAQAALATPALFRLEPGQTQVVRVGLLGPMRMRESEQAYRLFLTEVPTDAATSRFPTLRLLLRISIPVFALPLHPEIRPEWSARLAGNWLSLRLNNRGNVHLLINHLGIDNDRGQVVTSGSGLWYVLAGARRSWRLPIKAKTGDRVQVRAETDTATLTADVAASPR